MRRFAITSILALLVFLDRSDRASAQSWVAVGPPGGHVRSLAADPKDPRRIYLGTASGNLYRSEDGGESWRRLAPGFPLRGRSLDEIVVDPRGVVYVGYWEVHGKGGGIARSTNGGESFTILKDMDGRSVRAVAIAPADHKTIAAGTLDGVYLSKDAGKSWTRISPEGHADLRNFESLAFDPVNPEVLYAGTWHLAWKTTDAGETWSPVHKGMIDDSHVMTLTVVPRDSELLYATACTGVYRSTDGGREWMKLHGIPYASRRTRAFFQGGHEGSVLIAGTTEGLWMSEDGGGTWRCATPRELVINSLVVRPDGTIVLGTEQAGVLLSGDRGYTWTASNAGFSERFVSRMAFDAESRRLLVAVQGDPRWAGIFASPTSDGPWTHLGGDGIEGRQVLAIAPLGETVIAGTDEGLFRRGPSGESWTRLPMNVQGKDLRPRVTELLTGAGGRLVAGTTTGLLRSLDGGRTWDRPHHGIEEEVAALAASPRDPDRMLLATTSGIHRSEDGGASWTAASTAPEGAAHAVAYSPADDRVAFATTSRGLYRTEDGGDTWAVVSGGLPQTDLTGIAIDPEGRTIYVSDFTWGGVFRSRDGGETWKRMPVDGLSSDRVWTVSVDPESPDELLVGASAGGLHRFIRSMAAGPQGASSSQSRLPAPMR